MNMLGHPKRKRNEVSDLCGVCLNITVMSSCDASEIIYVEVLRNIVSCIASDKNKEFVAVVNRTTSNVFLCNVCG